MRPAVAVLVLAACRSTSVPNPPAPAATTVSAERVLTPKRGGSDPSPADPAVALPRIASGGAPFYPEMSRRLHEEGTVELEIAVFGDGTVKELAIARSSGHRRLDEAALEAARAWSFHPRTGAGGVARIRHRVVFQLTD